MLIKPKATIDDLYRVPENGKAELVNGEVIPDMPTGDAPAYAGGVIFAELLAHARQTRVGRAYPDNVGYHVNLPNRESFSPDASYYTGPRTGMRFLEGTPDFAVEVRSENDYGPVAEKDMEDKRADYFAAGTRVVWDVDLLNEPVIRKYVAPDAEQPASLYWRGDTADAEPAVPGWVFDVDTLFD